MATDGGLIAPDTDGDTAIFDTDRFVTDLYAALLSREPEAGRVAEASDRFRRGLLTPGELMREVLGSAEFSRRTPIFLRRFAIGETRGLFNDQTQYGELHLLLRAWLDSTAHSRFIVDVGARGRERSNSYDLLRYFGWRGLLVEANPNLIESIRREFGGLDVQIANCAVSNYNGRATFTIGSNDDVSSLDPSAAQRWGEVRGEVSVSVRRLPDLLDSYGAPQDIDLLSIDIEGEDVRVLNDVVDDGRFRPHWILIEASYDFATGSLEDLPTSAGVRRGYSLAGQNQANLLLRRVAT